MTSERTIRFMLVVHYDGSAFHGWQIQPETRTVQGVLQTAAETLTDGPRTLTGSGRTDRGVHATGQVASVEVPESWSPAAFRTSMNAVLPEDVWIQEVRRVGDGFHPRYDATGRSYLYRLGTTDEAHSPFHRPFCWPMDDAVDRDLLDRAAALVPGQRSFEAFAKSGQPERGTRCRVREAAWQEWDGLGLTFTVTADRFLHHMVRYLVGTMAAVATGRRPLSEMAELLEGGPAEGLWTSPPAPAQGLYLHRVDYPDEALIEPEPESSLGAAARPPEDLARRADA